MLPATVVVVEFTFLSIVKLLSIERIMTIFGAFITPDGSGVTMWFVVGPMLLLYVIGMLILEERSRLFSKDINTACGLMSKRYINV